MARQRNKSISLEALKLSFAHGTFVPLYLLSGDEEFLVDEALRSLVDHAFDTGARSFNLDIVYGGEIDAKDVVALASAFPMMSERRVVVVKNADRLASSEPSRDILLRYLESPMPSTVLVFVASKVDMRLSVFKIFQERGVVAEFTPLYESNIPEWIANRIQKFGRSIGPEACQLLQAHVGNSLRQIQNEIEKLLIYVGDKNTIEPEDVSALVGMSRSYNIFELQKLIGQGEAARAVEILEYMLDAGESPLGIIVMLTRFFQKLWVLPSLRRQTRSEFELASSLQVSPFFVSEYITASRRFPVRQIEHAFNALLDADLTLKSTQDDPRLVMTLLIHRLLRPVEEPVGH